MIKKRTSLSTEKILAVAGIILILLGCISNSYGALTNQRFIHDFLDGIYYLRFVLLLGGGFVLGYFLSKSKGYFSKAMTGSFYALFAITLYNVLDSLRVVMQRLFGETAFPWSKIFFEGMPLAALAMALLILVLSRNKTGQISTLAKSILVITFVTHQLFLMVTAPVELAWASYLFSPLAIFLVAYALFGRVKSMLERNFLAAFIGVFYSTLPTVLWEFQTDPSVDAVRPYAIAIMVISIVAAVFLVLATHRALPQIKR